MELGSKFDRMTSSVSWSREKETSLSMPSDEVGDVVVEKRSFPTSGETGCAFSSLIDSDSSVFISLDAVTFEVVFASDFGNDLRLQTMV